ncbi:MAG: head GIN domain-containing protein [Flammeovirgaceae bacterium]
MKIQTILFAVLACMCLLTTSCDDEWDAIEDEIDCRRAKGSRVERELTLPTFHSIELEVDANVFISLGSEQKVRVEGESDVVGDIERNVWDGVWYIEFDHCYKRYDDLDIYITVTDLKMIDIQSSGYVLAQTDFNVDEIDFRISGSGNIIMNDLVATTVSSTVTGSGNILISGNADTHNAYITGSGDITTFGFETVNTDVTIVGSGNAEVRVSSDLDVGIVGSGNVYYKGEPTVSSSISGSGKVVKVN